MNKLIFSIVLFSFVLTSCDEDTKIDSKLIEYVEVEGVCHDIYVKQPTSYFGRLEHRHIKTKRRGKDVSYDSFTAYLYQPNYDAAKIAIDGIKNPGKPYMPYNMFLFNIPESEFSKSVMVIPAPYEASERTSSNKTVSIRKNATCKLKVTRRLDHLPPEVVAERNKYKR